MTPASNSIKNDIPIAGVNGAAASTTQIKEIAAANMIGNLRNTVLTLAYNVRHTGEQLVASPAPQARCAGACYGFQVLLVSEACSTSSAFIKAEIIAR